MPLIYKQMRAVAGSLFLFAAFAMSTQTVGWAAGDAAAERQALMKNVGAATKVVAGMVKGQAPFDAVAAQLALRTLNNAAFGIGYMFPEGSQTGSETEAAPAIWSDRDGFNKAVNKFAADTSAEVKDLDSLKAVFEAATSNCGACHKAYRIKKD